MPISAATKNKLNIFQFGADSKTPEDGQTAAKKIIACASSDDKENTVLEKGQGSLKFEDHHVSQLASRQDNSNQGINPPTTPAGRLALPDLIGMVDVQSVEQEISPDERIMWDHGVNAVNSSASSYGALRRVKKRARSSSPTSSPAQTSSHFSGRSDAFGLQCLNLTLKTPQADPANDLWGRYGLNVEQTTVEAPPLPALAHIMYTSSPQSSKDGVHFRSEGSLRKSIGRSNSCGTDWPKRRKLVTTDEQPLEDVFTESFNAGPSKLSLVSALLGKVQDGFGSTGKPNRAMQPSSSSPIGNTAFISEQEEGSPLRQMPHQKATCLGEVEAPVICPSFRNIDRADSANRLRDDSDSSDYGDFDDEAFEESVVEVPVINSVSASSGLFEGGTQSQALSRDEVHIERFADMEMASNPVPQENEDEDFGDMDEETCAEDLESMVARYDLGMPVEVAMFSESAKGASGVENGVSKSLAQTMVSGTESEDEFGDSFSETDFDAAEAAATQSLQHSACSQAPVRIKFL
jgi:DNA replication ATP-dependent helicase Dna2